jgi:histidinol-phosphate aminotransferase
MLQLDFNERADSIPKWVTNFEANTLQLWQYPNRKEVETLIAKNFNVSPDKVFLSNGGDESIELLFKLCKLQQQSVLLPLPAFSQYTHQLGIWGIDFLEVESLDNLSIDIEELINKLQPNQWLIITRPNNPTGECISDSDLINLIESAKNINANVFLDEAYIEFYTDNSGVNFALDYDNVISLRTFSKAFGLAGARLGYLLGNENLIKQFKRYAMPFNVNNLSLQVAKLALQNITEMESYCEIIATNRQQIYNFLASRDIEVCESKGNFLLFKVNPEIKQILSSFMNRNEIKIKTSLNDLPNWVRITIPEKTDLLLAVLKTVFQPEIIGFDMDGVLIDTSESYDLCILETIKYFSKKTIDVTQVIQLREQGGFNNDWELTQKLLQQLGCSVLLDEVITQFQKYYTVFKDNETNLLKRNNLFEKNYITAIITGRPRDEARNGVKQLAIDPDFIISADDVNQQKPSPEGVNWLKSFTGKTYMWFCGDTVDDMQAGRAANCVCIGIGENKENLYKAGADIVLNNINQLEDLL